MKTWIRLKTWRPKFMRTVDYCPKSMRHVHHLVISTPYHLGEYQKWMVCIDCLYAKELKII